MVAAAEVDSNSMFDSKPVLVLDILRSMLAAGVGEVAVVNLECIVAVALHLGHTGAVDSCTIGLVRGCHWQHFGVVHIQTVPFPFVQTVQSAGNVPICRLSIRWEGGMVRMESCACTDHLRLLPAFLRLMAS